jgi:hypothetical protein
MDETWSFGSVRLEVSATSIWSAMFTVSYGQDVTGMAVSSLVKSVLFPVSQSGRTIIVRDSIGFDGGRGFKSHGFVHSKVNDKTKVFSDSLILGGSSTFPARTFTANHDSSEAQKGGISLGLVGGIIGSILAIVFASLIILFVVKRRRQTKESIPGEIDTMEGTVTLDDETGDEPEYVNPISDGGGGKGSGSDPFEVDGDENLSLV